MRMATQNHLAKGLDGIGCVLLALATLELIEARHNRSSMPTP